jgi:hypothetical protein
MDMKTLADGSSEKNKQTELIKRQNPDQLSLIRALS